MQLINEDKFVAIIPATPTGPIPRNDRDFVINQFTAKLQAEWKPYYIKNGKKIKVAPVTTEKVAIRLSYLKSIDDLYYLLSVCNDAQSFSKMFNHLIKVKTIEQKKPEQNV